MRLRTLFSLVVPLLLADATRVAAQPAPGARLAEAFAAGATAWSLLSGHPAEPVPDMFEPLRPDEPASGAKWLREGERIFAEPGRLFAVAAYTVPASAAGFHVIADSFLRRDPATPGTIDLRVFVQRARPAGRPEPVAVTTTLGAGEQFDFDSFLGYLDAGDRVFVAIGAAGNPAGDRTEIDFRIVRAPEIAVSAFPEDFDRPGAFVGPAGWWLADDVPSDSASARHLAWGRDGGGNFRPHRDGSQVTLPAVAREAVASFRVPHSGYYALHDAWVRSVTDPVGVRILVGRESSPRHERNVAAGAAPASLNADLGYVAKGDVIHLAFSGHGKSGSATAEFAGTIVEWAPRRAPLRVRRGADGLLDVYEPAAPRTAIDIPRERWITVPAPAAGDAGDAIRQAFQRARASRPDTDYVGVRLEAGKTYTLGAGLTFGTIFSFRDTQPLVFDGNGATLRIDLPDIARREVRLFALSNSRNVALADFVVEATTIPFTTGRIIAVSPRPGNTQTVTFQVDPGALDPLQDISREGVNNAYAYDPATPGRLALGTWTHYPGSGIPNIRATDTPGVFTHRVTRTDNSIEPGGKWLLKNKRGGVIYLSTRAGTEDVTLSGVDGRASGGGHLRFVQTSGINLIDCRFEPDGDNWISSSADAVHGRGREGVWIENTIFRGICEDIMNTYGQNMVVVADGDERDAVMSLRMYDGSVESKTRNASRPPNDESVAVGDQLVFFNPHTGRVLGYADVRAIAAGRFTLSNPVPDVVPWKDGTDRGMTMVYNTRVAARFFVRDSRFMDSMRFGIYIKARGGVVFNSQFEGLSGPSIFATNEPEWPEGPPATHLWVQGCTFSQNNYGYMPRQRDFMVVDPADISIYTRRLRQRGEPDDHRAHVTREQHANSNMKLLENVFHDWRGMGISVRNSRNVRLEGNVFLPPANDEVLRATFAADPALAAGSRGRYAAIFLGSVVGVNVAGNSFHGLPEGDRPVVAENDVSAASYAPNIVTSPGVVRPTVAIPFREWFGVTSAEPLGFGAVVEQVDLRGARHRAGRLGAGLEFSGGGPATFARSADFGTVPLAQFTVALWARPASAKGDQVVYAQGDARHGIVIAVTQGRWLAGAWRDARGAWLDLGPALAGQWQHLALVGDGPASQLIGYVDGLELEAATRHVPPQLEPAANGATLGGTTSSTRLGERRELPAGAAAYRGAIDEFHFFPGRASPADLAALALRAPQPVRE